jgi:putative FmdB family regulatory protein
VPTYEYECDKCRGVFEIRQRISEPALTVHDGCGGAVRRLLSPAPFILKGDGWYVTDYPSESRKKAMETEKGTKTDKADKAEPKTDAKPASSATDAKPAASSADSAKPSTTTSSAGASSSST